MFVNKFKNSSPMVIIRSLFVISNPCTRTSYSPTPILLTHISLPTHNIN